VIQTLNKILQFIFGAAYALIDTFQSWVCLLSRTSL